jgi:hypothetical protein
MPRAQNAHAYVNAGFLFRLNGNNGGKVLAKPTVVFGGINPQFVSMMMMMMMMMMMTTTTMMMMMIIIRKTSQNNNNNTHEFVVI